MAEQCESVHPDTGQRCEMRCGASTVEHALHVAPGVTWTSKDVEDAKDPQKVLVRTIKDATRALNRVAEAVEHYTQESLHKVR